MEEGTVRCLYERTLLRLYYSEAAVGVESRWSSFLGLSTGRSYQEIVNHWRSLLGVQLSLCSSRHGQFAISTIFRFVLLAKKWVRCS
jgi:hypothetical protein